MFKEFFHQILKFLWTPSALNYCFNSIYIYIDYSEPIKLVLNLL